MPFDKYRSFVLWSAVPIAFLSLRVGLEAGIVPAVLVAVALFLSPFITIPAQRRFDARRSALAGTRLRTHATLFLPELEKFPRLAPPLSRRARRRVRWWVKGFLGGSVDTTEEGLRWRSGRLCPKLPDLFVAWSDVLGVEVRPSPMSPLNVVLAYQLRTGETLHLSVRNDDAIIEVLTAVPLDPLVPPTATGWAGARPEEEPARIPNMARRPRWVLVGLWVGALAILNAVATAQSTTGRLVWTGREWMMLALPFLALGLLLIDSRRAGDVSETAALASLLVAGADAIAGHPAAGVAEAAGLAVVLVASWVVRGHRNPDPQPSVLAPRPPGADASLRRIPDADRAAFGVLWAAGFGYQLFGCETANDMGDLQFLFVCCLVVALALTGWSLYRSSPRAALWSLAACLSGFAASALDFGPVPAVARHEFVIYGTLAIVTAAFYARWLPPGRPRPGRTAGSPHPAG